MNDYQTNKEAGKHNHNGDINRSTEVDQGIKQMLELGDKNISYYVLYIFKKWRHENNKKSKSNF